MLKKYLLVILLLFIFLLGLFTINGEKEDIYITVYGKDHETAYRARGEDGEFTFTIYSDISIDIYVISHDDYWEDVADSYTPDYSDAEYTNKGVYSLTFTFTIPDDQLYHLVISNPNYGSATVEIEIEYFSETDNTFTWCSVFCLGIIAIIAIVVVLIIIVFLFRRKRTSPPPSQPIVQQNIYQPPPPPSYPPPQYPPPQYPPPQQ